ncbi:TIGR02679 family protein [Iamia sp.]|uniref:TIGR02679 family protein n=1 Tax=Iamia sp. TaxID=2722710 RepID=UPI002CB1FD52|nr:TIGR02679 family protein [Iamia sp.]HXH56229.1 TIGR02679 family protein [Iamia sp.]
MTAAPSDDRRERARVALAGAPFAPLWDRARTRLEGNGRRLEGTPLRLTGLETESRRAIAGLLGVSAAGEGVLRVDLADLDARLRTGAAEVALIDLLEGLGGPVRDRRAERAADRSAREDAWVAAEGHPVLAARPELAAWVATTRRAGTATRLAGSAPAGGALALAALDVVSHLPAAHVPLAVLAAEATGDAHALDRGRPLGTLVGGALAVLDPEEADDPWRPDWPTAGAYWWRRRWARAGVVCDDLSVSVLALNLPVASSGAVVGGSIHDHGAVGEPLRLTLRQLAVGEIEVVPGVTVHVCENPSVVAQAAALLECTSAPLVCVEGQPNTAVHTLLDLLAAAGSAFRYHGDFDWDGVRIGAALIARYAMAPWRFSAEDYAEAVPLGRLGLGTSRGPVTAPWSPGLPARMETEAVAIHEEQVLGPLIADLDGRRRCVSG